MARTKIVCTIGPASRSSEILEQLIRAGMDVARLNFSHGTQTEHLEVITTVRRIAERLGRPSAMLQDVAGLKIRVGEIASGAVMLEAGAPFTLTTRQVLGSRQEVSVDYPHLTEDVQHGDRLLLSDGDLELEVIGTTGEDVHCRVITGRTLASRKGVNLPARSITTPTVTDKDRDDLAFGLRHGVDYVAQSFVRTAADVLEVRGMIQDHGSTVPLIAKIETQDALTSIDEIIDSVDGVMVARGDLGVAVPLATIPRLQKMLIGKANRAGKPVITATRMLGSMKYSPRPTRAEVTDVANAVLDGTDAIMLSEETAIGRFPLEAVRMMASVLSRTAFATSVTSARVGRGLSCMERSICVAVMTGLPARFAFPISIFCSRGTVASGTATPRSPRATMTPSTLSMISSMLVSASCVSILAIRGTVLP